MKAVPPVTTGIIVMHFAHRQLRAMVEATARKMGVVSACQDSWASTASNAKKDCMAMVAMKSVRHTPRAAAKADVAKPGNVCVTMALLGRTAISATME